MFKEFWESKRQYVEATGIIVALGALFLSIPLPSDSRARTALLNLQFLWLLLITLCVAILGWHFYDLADRIEQKVVKPYIVGFRMSLTIIVGGMTLRMLSALWTYMLALYRQPLLDFLGMVNGVIQWILPAYFLFARRRIQQRFRAHRGRYVAVLAGAIALAAAIAATANEVSMLRFVVSEWSMRAAGAAGGNILGVLTSYVLDWVGIRRKHAQANAQTDDPQS